MIDGRVVNASPLILLGAIGQIHLLERLSQVLVIPEAVAREVEAGGPSDPTVEWLAGSGRAYIQACGDPGPGIQAWGLGAGESAVLEYAIQNPGFETVLDDQAARKCALAHGLKCRGTVGIIVLAKRRGILPAAGPVLKDLCRAGSWIDDRLIKWALEEAGEG